MEKDYPYPSEWRPTADLAHDVDPMMKVTLDGSLAELSAAVEQAWWEAGRDVMPWVIWRALRLMTVCKDERAATRAWDKATAITPVSHPAESEA